MTEHPGVDAEQYIGSRIEHLNITVTDIARSRRFYELTLGSIGIDKILDVGSDIEHQPAMVGVGYDHKPFFWLVQGEHVDANLHVAFSVGSRRAVQVFYDQALAAGAASKLAPCLRPEYQPHYYGGFVYAPTG
jgi:catechol 2,3-dioxygenase-like lactoylglutathione lyase family enzyme